MELLKCLPCLYYGLEACPVNKLLMKSLKFVLNGVIRKIFVTKSNDAVNDCLSFFNCVISGAIYNRKLRFLSELTYSDNMLFALVINKICSELSIVELYTACYYT